MTHPGKKDWWIAGLLAVIAAVTAVPGGILLGTALVGGQWPALFPAAVLLLAALMMISILYNTSYEITETSLLVRAGPFRRTIPLDAIEEVVPQTHWYGGPALEWNFGLSVMGLRLRYRKANGRLSWVIRISPQDRSAFLLELSERLPALVAKDDGSLRRAAGLGSDQRDQRDL